MAAVTLRVLRSDGTAAADAMVGVPHSSVPVPEMAFLADGSGTVRLVLPQGQFTVEAYTQNGARGVTEVVVTSGKEITAQILLKGDEH
jgi:hypothetical protein